MKVITFPFYEGRINYYNIIYDNSTTPWTLLSTDVSLHWARRQNKDVPQIFICGRDGDIKDIR